METWKKVDGYDYEVSTHGRIRSLDRKVLSRYGSRTHRGRLLIKNITKSNGYYGVTLYRNNVGFSTNLHRLIALTFIPKPDSDIVEVNHKNGIKIDNRVENLEWITRSGNVIHSYKTGLKISPNGSSHYKSILDDLSILVIRSAYESGLLTQLQIANYFGVCRQHVSRIINNKAWNHV